MGGCRTPSEPEAECSVAKMVPVPPKQANTKPRPGKQNRIPPEPTKDVIVQGMGSRAAAGLKQNAGAANLLGAQASMYNGNAANNRHNAYAAAGKRNMRTSCAVILA